ncbi:hypothetical protein RFI_36831, partial [Reticulomyxa filosa]
EQFQDLKCLKMKVQSNQLELTPDLEKQLSRFVERTDKKIIRRIMTAWTHVAKKENRVETQPSKLIKDYLQNTYFFSDELNFFPQQSFSWDYCINGYNFVVSCYENLKTIKIHSTPIVMIDFMEIFEHANLQWEKGKEVTFIYLFIFLKVKENVSDINKFKQTKKEKEKFYFSSEQWEAQFNKLWELHDTWQKFKQSIEMIRKYHQKKNEIINDTEWKTLEEKLDMSKQLLEGKAEMSIEDAIHNYDWCVEYFGDIKEYVNIIELIISNEQKIQTVASDEMFADNTMFNFALEKLKNCDTEKFHQLIEPLYNVNQPLQEKIWKTDFKGMCVLARTVLTIMKENETFVMQLEQCLKVDLHALLRVMKKGDDVMVQKKKDEFVQAHQQGDWLFDDYDTIYSAYSRLKSGRYEGLSLQFGSNKLTCEEIEHSIDLLKLGLTSEEKKDIETIISQFEICKDIYAIRMDYWEKGGTSSQDKLKLAASNPIPNFESQKIMWVEKLKQWNKDCIELRHKYPCLAYFTMNEIQQLVKDLNHIKAHEPQYWDILASKYIVPFLQRLDYQIQDASQVLHKWKNQNSKDMRSLQELGCIFSKVWMKSKNNQNAPNSISILSSLKSGRPNLVIANQNNKLFSMLSLYESIGLIPRAEHVLLCKETTTEEEVECLILRALLYVKDINSKTSLYCLVWPEKLQIRILEKVVNLFQKYFFEPSRSRRIQLYLFAVISSNHDNALSYFLRGLEWNVSGELNNHQFNINEALYSQKFDILPPNARGHSFYRVKLYEFTKVGLGKSWKIQRDIQCLQQQTSRVQSVRLRFNSGNIDWEDIVKTLWTYHPCQVNSASKDSITGVNKRIKDFNYFKDNWIVYHIDVSSCVNKDINDFFFQLLYLQHIDAMNCSFHVNPNMIFFIEIPCKLDMFSDTPHNFFYTLFFNTRFQMKSKLPAFNVGDKGRSSIEWMEGFFAGKLEF